MSAEFRPFAGTATPLAHGRPERYVEVPVEVTVRTTLLLDLFVPSVIV